MGAAACSLFLRERARVREAEQSAPSPPKRHSEPRLPGFGLAASLTPALSRREREKDPDPRCTLHEGAAWT